MSKSGLPENCLSRIPQGIRDSLIKEYHSVMQNFTERRWTSVGQSSGRFCEVAYNVVAGLATSNYPTEKPRSLADACKQLENKASLPRGLRMLALKLLPAVYEIRNNRDMSHVNPGVDSHYMDCAVLVSMCSWIMAELIRTQHAELSAHDVQNIVDSLSERNILLIWEDGDVKRVLVPGMRLESKILVLLHSCVSGSNFTELRKWAEAKNKMHMKKVLQKLHKEKKVEFNESSGAVKILPPGGNAASKEIQKHRDSNSAI